jgi:hypothetical protein
MRARRVGAVVFDVGGVPDFSALRAVQELIKAGVVGMNKVHS